MAQITQTGACAAAGVGARARPPPALRACAGGTLPCSAGWPTSRQQRRPRLPSVQPPRALHTELALLAADAALAPLTFEPQLRPEIMVAAGCAATPPILFWARIFAAQLRRQREIDEAAAQEARRQQEREQLKRKITGQPPRDEAPPS